MAQRVTAIFRSREEAERAADALTDLGADRGHISMMARGDKGKIDTTSPTGLHPGADLVEPAREVGDSGAPLTTSDKHDAATGAAVGAVAGLAAGLLALTVPGIGLVLAAGPLAAAIAGGAVVGGVYGGLRDIGIEEKHARGYEERIRGGHVLLTALVPSISQQQVRDLLAEYDAEDVTFAEDTSMAGMPAPAATGTIDAPAATAPMAGAMTTRTVPEMQPVERDVQLRRERVAVDDDGEVEVEELDETATRRAL